MNRKNIIACTSSMLPLISFVLLLGSIPACSHKPNSGSIIADSTAVSQPRQRERQKSESGNTRSNKADRRSQQQDTDNAQFSSNDASPTTRDKRRPNNAPNLPELLFDYNSTELTSASRRALRRYARWLAGNDYRVRLVGHTDERGTKEYNLALGRLRAQSVADFLGRQRVYARRMVVVSYGEEAPLVRGTSEAAWRRNRRVELDLL